MTRAPTSRSDPAAAIDRHLGLRLARRRRRAGKSRAELDEAIAAAPGTVAAFERGARSMDVAHLFALGRALGVTVHYFFEDLPHPPPGTKAKTAPVPGSRRVREAERFIDAYFRIADRRLRRDIRGLVKAAAEGRGQGA